MKKPTPDTETYDCYRCGKTITKKIWEPNHYIGEYAVCQKCHENHETYRNTQFRKKMCKISIGALTIIDGTLLILLILKYYW